MNEPFPIGFPTPTALYLTLYVVTLAVHVLFMSYVLAGSTYLAFAALAGRGAPPKEIRTIRGTLQDWLPFSVGVAITAGVAPLLFIQILYEKRFYTANLLLFHRWMLIVPALIVGFYLLYLMKTGWAQERKNVWRVIATSAFGCFAFVAWSFTENHLLSRDADAWVATYASGLLLYRSPEVIPRLLVWFFGATTVAAPVLGWQLRAGGVVPDRDEVQHLARISLVGLAGAALASLAYLWIGRPEAATVALTPLTLPYTAITVLAAIAQAIAWIRIYRARRLTVGSLSFATTALGASLLGSGVVREAVRLEAIDLEALYPNHARAFEAGGLGLFLFFLLSNVAIIVYAVRLGARAARREGPPESSSGDDVAEAA